MHAPAGERAVHCARLPEAPLLDVQLGQQRRQLHLWVYAVVVVVVMAVVVVAAYLLKLHGCPHSSTT